MRVRVLYFLVRLACLRAEHVRLFICLACSHAQVLGVLALLHALRAGLFMFLYVIISFKSIKK